MFGRLKSSLVLTPAIMFLLVWIGRFSGGDEVMRIGIFQFLLWACASAFAIAYCITFYAAYLCKLKKDE